MGGDSSQSIENTFNFSAINENITNIITEKSTTTSATGANIQGMTVNLGKIIGCDMNFSQKITSKTMAASDFEDDDIIDLQSQITNDMQAAAESALENNTEMGSELGGLLDGGDTNMEVKNEVNMEIKNLVETNIKTTIVNNTVAEQVNIQDGILNLKYYDCSDTGAKLDFSQDIMAEVKATSIMKLLREAIQKNKVLNKMAAVTEASVKKKKGGIAGVLDSVFGGIAGVIGTSQQGAMAGSAASVSIVCVLVIGLAVMFLSPAGQNMGRKGMNKF
jgi:hypothetical protein